MRAGQFVVQIVILAAVATLWAGSAKAMPVFFSWGGEKVIKVKDFPDAPQFYNDSVASYVDVGYRVKQVTILFLPVWNYEGTWCGYVGSDETYLDVTKQDLRQVAKAGAIEFPEEPTLPFWDRWGGKLIFGGIILLYALYSEIRRRGG